MALEAQQDKAQQEDMVEDHLVDVHMVDMGQLDLGPSKVEDFRNSCGNENLSSGGAAANSVPPSLGRGTWD